MSPFDAFERRLWLCNVNLKRQARLTIEMNHRNEPSKWRVNTSPLSPGSCNYRDCVSKTTQVCMYNFFLYSRKSVQSMKLSEYDDECIALCVQSFVRWTCFFFSTLLQMHLLFAHQMELHDISLSFLTFALTLSPNTCDTQCVLRKLPFCVHLTSSSVYLMRESEVYRLDVIWLKAKGCFYVADETSFHVT